MEKLIDKLWNWGHLECSHNECTGLQCEMTPEEFADEYGIKKSFIISYGGNIQPPFDNLAKRFSKLKEIKWFVAGDSSTPETQNELGETENIIRVLNVADNITGGIIDDFFQKKERVDKYTPNALKKIHEKLNDKNLDFWSVLYDYELDKNLSDYLDNFDGISFWLWGCEKINDIDKYLDKFFKLAKGKKIMLGMYLWDYKSVGKQPMDSVLFEKQLKMYFKLLKEKRIEGVVFCSSTVGDADLETNRILKQYIKKYGQYMI